ncbi:hypothetical protein [Dictyobacter kobayashii]|uniref:Uncharacterized protein n=1 Tax=Dictyobacter kobayashii TaxID=2014872 RepID=A0A402AM86_9CHLR|nr:hypothetical protein [Dictyobacter kobayashii]GCE20144.1 hypothetical protein KDK_39440 [Dictyobacter kobayashii]
MPLNFQTATIIVIALIIAVNWLSSKESDPNNKTGLIIALCITAVILLLITLPRLLGTYNNLLSITHSFYK